MEPISTVFHRSISTIMGKYVFSWGEKKALPTPQLLVHGTNLIEKQPKAAAIKIDLHSWHLAVSCRKRNSWLQQKLYLQTVKRSTPALENFNVIHHFLFSHFYQWLCARKITCVFVHEFTKKLLKYGAWSLVKIFRLNVKNNTESKWPRRLVVLQ